MLISSRRTWNCAYVIIIPRVRQWNPRWCLMFSKASKEKIVQDFRLASYFDRRGDWLTPCPSELPDVVLPGRSKPDYFWGCYLERGSWIQLHSSVGFKWADWDNSGMPGLDSSRRGGHLVKTATLRTALEQGHWGSQQQWSCPMPQPQNGEFLLEPARGWGLEKR